MNNLTKISFVTFLIFLLSPNISLEAQSSLNISGDALFGAMRARHIGPAVMSGRVSDMTGHPKDSRIIYVGSAGGGVWRSTDGGVSYQPIFDEYAQSIGAVELDPNDPDNTIWVGTGEVWTRNSVSVGDGLYKSTSGGKTWEKIGFENSERISSIKINPENSNEVYVGVMGALWGDSEDRGLYKSTDGGKSWEKNLYVDETTGCSDLQMDPNDPNTLYAAFWEFRRTAYSFNSGGQNSALYKTTDGGKSWNKIHNGYPVGKLGRIAIAIAPSNPDILYSVIESAENKDKGLYRSDDAGASWTHVNNDFELTVRPFYFSRVVIDPRNPDKVAKAGYNGSISEDGGKTFRAIGSGVHPDIHDFWFDPNDPNRIYLGCDGGVYRSYDGGHVWEMVKGLPLSQFYHVTVDNEKPFNVFGGLQDNGSWVGPSEKDGGIKEGDWKGVGYGDGFRVYPHPENSNIVYSEMQGAEGVWRVDVRKNQSKTIKPYPEKDDPKLRFNWNAPITTSIHQSDRLYIGSQFLHVSEDQGDSWRKISGDLTTNDPTKQNQVESGGLSRDNSGAENHCTIFTISESPLTDQIIWVGTDDGNVQVTTNGGKNWANVTDNLDAVPKNTWVYHIEPSSHDQMTAYAVFDGHTQNDGNAYVQKTTDGGKTWKNIATEEIDGFARSIQEDYVNPDLLFLGTEFGLYITVNGGASWSKFKNNMPAVAVHHVTLHPTEHALVMGTHGRGVIIIDDITPLRKMTAEVAAEAVHFFDNGPSVIREGGAFGGGSHMGDFVGENPTRAAEIVYFMKSRHTFGKMTMEVFDGSGNKIADLPPGKAKGINKVRWNYRYKMPKIAKGKTLTFGGFTTPTVPPGSYTVRITKAKKVYETKIELQSDPNSIHSDADRIAQHNAAMELYRMNEELAYIVDQIDLWKEGVDANLAASSVKKLSKMLTSFGEDLNVTKEPLVIMTGDNYVGAAEPQLREKIASLYSEVAGYSGKPSYAQMANLSILEGRLDNTRSKMKDLRVQVSEINKACVNAGLPEIKIKSREEFFAIDP